MACTVRVLDVKLQPCAEHRPPAGWQPEGPDLAAVPAVRDLHLEPIRARSQRVGDIRRLRVEGAVVRGRTRRELCRPDTLAVDGRRVDTQRGRIEPGGSDVIGDLEVRCEQVGGSSAVAGVAGLHRRDPGCRPVVGAQADLELGPVRPVRGRSAGDGANAPLDTLPAPEFGPRPCDEPAIPGQSRGGKSRTVDAGFSSWSESAGASGATFHERRGDPPVTVNWSPPLSTVRSNGLRTLCRPSVMEKREVIGRL